MVRALVMIKRVPFQTLLDHLAAVLVIALR